MKQSKHIFIAIAITVIIACILAFWFFGPSSDPDSSQSSNPTQETHPAVSGDVTVPNAPVPTDPEPPEIVVSREVSIQQVEKDPNEVIDRTTNFSPEHPEYIDFGDENPYCCASGLVFRNDKTITIRVEDPLYDAVHNISFGFITGRCNRFLYLNPSVESTIGAGPWLFKFQAVNGGSILTINDELESPFDSSSHTITRVLDLREDARYLDAQHPGAVWFTMAPLSGPFYIDCLVMGYDGEYFATLRLTIAQAEDGTYSIVDLDNRDMKYNDQDEYTYEELEYLLSIAHTTIEDPDITRFTAIKYIDTYNTDAAMDEVYFDLRDQESGLYFDHFVPTNPSWTPECSHYTDQLMPIIAVTFRNFTARRVYTLYFQVTTPPYDGNHGEYSYIGRDYIQYASAVELKGAGYKGADLYGEE